MVYSAVMSYGCFHKGWVCSAVAAGVLLLSGAAALAQAARQALVGEAPLEITREGALVTLQGPDATPYPFLLDAQAPLSTLHLGLAPALGLSLDNAPVAAGNRLQGYRAVLPGFAAGAVPLYVGEGLLADVAPLADAMNRPLAGVLSLSAFPGPLRMDFENGRLYTWFAETSYRPPGAVPLRIGPDGVPRMRVLVNGRRMLWFTVDLSRAGAAGMPEPLLRELGALDEKTSRLSFVRDDAPSPPPRIRLDKLQAGAVTVRGPVCAVMPEGAKPWLGVGLFRDDALALSIRAEPPWLHPGTPRRVEANSIEGTGLVPWERVAGLWRAQVVAGSPAERLGLLPGDVIETVNGAPAAPLDYAKVSRLLSQPAGSEVDVVCSREDVRFDLAIPCEKLF